VRETRTGAQWRKAPWVLRRHPAVLAGVLAAALLLALAAASAPFVSTAAASQELKNKLAELSPLATGLELDTHGILGRHWTVRGASEEQAARERAVEGIAAQVGSLGRPVVTLMAGPFDATAHESLAGAFPPSVILMARTGVLSDIHILAKTSGPGLWVESVFAKELGLHPGDRLVLHGYARRPGGVGETKVAVRVKGIYRALIYEPHPLYWVNFWERIYPRTFNSPQPTPFAFGTTAQILAISHSLGPFVFENVYELPVDPAHVTLARGRRLSRAFASVGRELAAGRSATARTLGCTSGPVPDQLFACTTSSSLSAAVAIADRNVSAISPAVTLIAGVGVLVGLGVAAAAGAFLVRRRRAEAALAYARGEHVASFAARTGLEALLPTLAGGLAGFALALGTTSLFAHGSLDPDAVRTGAWRAAAAVVVGLGLLVAVAAAAFLGLYETGSRSRRWLRWLPWELPLLAVGLWLLADVRSGGGLTAGTENGGRHPTLAVFLVPLLLVAAVAGLGARLARAVLRRRGAGGPTPAFLARRRLAAARGLLIVLAVVSAVAFGACVYAETLAASLHQTTVEKAYMATGSDATGSIDASLALPRRFPYPVTKVEFGNQVATVGGNQGTQVDVMLVDPATLPATLHWQRDWGRNPSDLVADLSRATSGPLPVIVTPELAHDRALYVEGKRMPVRVLGTVRAFPGMAAGVPLVVTSFGSLDRAARALGLYDPLGITTPLVWAKGPPEAVSRAIARPPLRATYVTNVDAFLHDPDVVLATRTFGFMRAIAIGAAVLLLLGLLLYLQARARAQTVASALARRMGLSRAAETLSFLIELGAILAFAAVVGGGIALAAARPVTRRLDPLPDNAPSPIFTIPTGELLLAALALLAVAVAAAALTSSRARSADVAEALRDA
jgi:putative ABC transport system permease protein